MPSPTSLRGLSVRQPFAGYIAQRRKTVEARTWPTDYRGHVLICSSQGTPLGPCRTRWTRPRGVALCVVNLYDCVLLDRTHHKSACLTTRDLAVLDVKGRRHYAWLLGFVREVPPLVVRGSQGLFTLPSETMRSLGYSMTPLVGLPRSES